MGSRRKGERRAEVVNISGGGFYEKGHGRRRPGKRRRKTADLSGCKGKRRREGVKPSSGGVLRWP